MSEGLSQLSQDSVGLAEVIENGDYNNHGDKIGKVGYGLSNLFKLMRRVLMIKRPQ